MGKMFQKRRGMRIISIMLAGMLINYAGKVLANKWQLPLWLDSIGTGLTASLLGPVYGAVCGGLNNVIYGLQSPISYAYGLTSVAIGLGVGFCRKKGYLRNIFTTMTVSVLIAVMSVVISTPLNIIFWDGAINNVWGDGLYGMLTSAGWNPVIASVLGELFVDFPDKVVMVLLCYVVLKLPFTARIDMLEIRKQETKAGTLLVAVVLSASLCALPVSAAVTAGDVQVQEEISGQSDRNIYAQTIYNSDNGLAAGEANAIIETPDGYIWIGTYAGLYRYDGRDFKMMSFDSVKNVNRLYVDKRGRLWIGTNDNGISVYENGIITDVLDKSNGLTSNSVRCIGEDSKGNYYVGTSASLCIVSDEDGLAVKKTFPDIIYANNISVSSQDLVAIVTNAGDLVLMNQLQVSGSYSCAEGNTYYTCCSFDKEDSLLIATSGNEVSQWDFEGQQPNVIKRITTGDLTYIHNLYEDQDGSVWICADSGIGYLNSVNHCTPVDTGAFNGTIDQMIRDYQGNLWFTSSRLGILKLTKNSFIDLYAQCGIQNQVVNSTAMWEGKLYSATDSGLEIIDIKLGSSEENELTEYLDGNRVRCLFVDSENHLWIATTAGVGLLEVTSDGSITKYGQEDGTVGERFRSVMQLSDGTIVAAENTGIDFIRDGRVVSTLEAKDGMTNPQILSMIETEDQKLLAGSDGDGIMVIRDGEVVDRLTEQDGLPSGVILRMVSVDDGFMIVTSNSLCYMDREYQIRELKNFPYSNNYDVIPAGDGKLWVLGSAGIYIVEKEALLADEKLNYELLDSRKGLKTSLTANSWNVVAGQLLYLSCNTGVYCIDMENYIVYQGDYRMMVDYVDDTDTCHAITVGEVMQIPKDAIRIRIRPELLNYTLNDPYVSYYLEGIAENEVIVQQSSLNDIVYTNLPAGTYVFHISVLNNIGTEVIESRSYILEKQPQFWEHTWFLAYLIFICAMGIAYVTWLIAVLNTNRIIERQKQEIELARKQAEMGNETILAIAKTMDAKDVNTSEHSERVAKYSVLIAQKLSWSKEACENLRKIALLHDIGKIGISDAILNKTDSLSEEEYATMKSHVLIGSEILKDFTIVEHVQDGVRYHHERYDGTGYVEGLKGEEIPKDSRIICLADAFDAMTANRVYRKHLNKSYVLSELKKGSGKQFDPELVTILLGLIADGNIRIEEI